MELDEHLIQRTAYARLFLALRRLVTFGEVEVSDEGVVHKGLQDNGHEACLAHVVQAAEADGAAGEEGRVADYELVVRG
jgi:hypothetical protein